MVIAGPTAPADAHRIHLIQSPLQRCDHGPAADTVVHSRMETLQASVAPSIPQLDVS